MIGHISGKGGENFAERFLIDRGAEILERNFRTAVGEIDIIARMEGRLVFVEVKARFGSEHGTPGEAITAKQKRRIRRAAEMYLKDHGGTAQPVRFDALLLSEDGVKYVKSAF